MLQQSNTSRRSVSSCKERRFYSAAPEAACSTSHFALTNLQLSQYGNKDVNIPFQFPKGTSKSSTCSSEYIFFYIAFESIALL